MAGLCQDWTLYGDLGQLGRLEELEEIIAVCGGEEWSVVLSPGGRFVQTKLDSTSIENMNTEYE